MQYDYVLIKRRPSETEAQAEHHVKNGSALPRAKGHQRLLVNDQKLGEKHGTVSLTTLRRNQSCQWQDLKPLGYRNLRQ